VADESPRYVLDSFALLAFLEDEAGAAKVEEILAACSAEDAEAWLSIVNLGEVAYITHRERGLPAAQQAIAAIDQLPVHVVDADRSRTFGAARIKARYPLSYADAFAVALGREVDGAVVTGDPEFENAEEIVRVLWLSEAQSGRST